MRTYWFESEAEEDPLGELDFPDETSEDEEDEFDDELEDEDDEDDDPVEEVN